jgi:hypothetical protein
MVVQNALYRMLATLGGSGLVAVAALVVAGPAHADDTFCFERFSGGGMMANDAGGNYWARLDTFDMGESECSAAEVDGLSIVVKTPFEIDSEPEIDDIDSSSDGSVLEGALADLYPDFGHFGFLAIGEVGGGAPSDFATFVQVGFCLYVDGPGDIDDCLTEGPTFLGDLTGEEMVFGAALGADAFELGFVGGCEGDCDFDFDLVTVLISDAIGEQVGNDVPEAVIGFQLAVPEPAPLALLGSVGAALFLGRRRALR